MLFPHVINMKFIREQLLCFVCTNLPNQAVIFLFEHISAWMSQISSGFPINGGLDAL